MMEQAVDHESHAIAITSSPSTRGAASTTTSILTSFREIEARWAPSAALRSEEASVPEAESISLWSYRPQQPDGPGHKRLEKREAAAVCRASTDFRSLSTAEAAHRDLPSSSCYKGADPAQTKLHHAAEHFAACTCEGDEVGAKRGRRRIGDTVDTGVLCGNLAMRGCDLVGAAGTTPRDVFLILMQRDKEVARTPPCDGGGDPTWDSVRVTLHRDFNVVVQCWEMNVSGDHQIGAATVRADEMTSPGARFHIQQQGKLCGSITVCCSDVTAQTLEDSSVVCMLQEQVFHSEGGGAHLNGANEHEHQVDFARFHVFRVHCLDQKLGVRYSTVNEGLGTAIAGRHFKATRGVVYFEAGASMASFDVEIPNDDCWEPIREFGVSLEEVVEGKGIVGALDICTCIVVDDDLYPRKCVRPEDMPMGAAERVLPSCVAVDKYLTVDEVGDFDLIYGFFLERITSLWPFSMWAFIWSLYRALYHVTMALVLIIFIDHVWYDTAKIPAEQVPADMAAAEANAKYRVFVAGFLSVAIVLMTIVQCRTETWIVDNCKFGLTGKQLRDWIVAVSPSFSLRLYGAAKSGILYL